MMNPTTYMQSNSYEDIFVIKDKGFWELVVCPRQLKAKEGVVVGVNQTIRKDMKDTDVAGIMGVCEGVEPAVPSVWPSDSHSGKDYHWRVHLSDIVYITKDHLENILEPYNMNTRGLIYLK